MSLEEIAAEVKDAVMIVMARRLIGGGGPGDRQVPDVDIELINAIQRVLMRHMGVF